MIQSAEEFVRLRTSQVPEEYWRAAHEEAQVSTWMEIIECFPEMRVWVAQNKTVPLSILEILRVDSDERVRSMVRCKGAWRRAHPLDYKLLGEAE